MEVVSVTHKRLGSRIKELRKIHNFTQEDLAEKVQVDRSYMGFVERGEKNPTLLTLIKIAKAFKITLSKLLDNID